MADPIETLRRLKEEEKEASSGELKKPCMFYLPVALDAEFRAFVGNGNASKIVDGLLREFLAKADAKGLLDQEDKRRMKAAAKDALDDAAKAKKRSR